MVAAPPLPAGSTSCQVDADCANVSTCIDALCYVPHARYLSVNPNSQANRVALEIALPDGRIGWIGEPVLTDDRGNYAIWAALVEDSADNGQDQLRDWSAYIDPTTGQNLVHVTGCVIAPDYRYTLRAIDATGSASQPLVLPTTPRPALIGTWGDVVGTFDGTTWSPPDGVVNVFDVSAVFGGRTQRIDVPTLLVDLAPQWPAYTVGSADVVSVSRAFVNRSYWEVTGAGNGTCSTMADCPLGPANACLGNGCSADEDCDDATFCNGAEFCGGGICLNGDAPCPNQACDEAADQCVGCASDAPCDNGLFCDGEERCASGFCLPGLYPCGPLACDEQADRCDAAPAGPMIEIIPTSATGPTPIIEDNRIVIPAGGETVRFDLFVSGWDDDGDGTPLLDAAQATIDEGSLLGTQAVPPSIDLIPAGWPAEPWLGAYQITARCFGGTLDDEPCGFEHTGPFVTDAECLAAGGLFCIDEPTFLLAGAFTVVSRVGLVFSWAAYKLGRPEGTRDDGLRHNIGTLVVDVPTSATGTYTIRANPDARLSFLFDQRNVLIDNVLLRPARLTIGDTSGDCQPNGVHDQVDLTNGTSDDCNGNGVPDECDVYNQTVPDCNRNLIPDGCDIADVTSEDCNGNARPDECDIADGVGQDCNDNGVIDSCEVDSGTADDCNDNGVPDVCDDCNHNGEPDVDDIAAATSLDCNDNCVPDECDIDCNANGLPDDCDISAGTSVDGNGDGVPDECLSPPILPAPPHDVLENRYLSLAPQSGAAVVAMAIDLPDGREGWVGEPVIVDFLGGDPQPVSWVVDQPIVRVWSESVVHVAGCVVIPDQQYEVRVTLGDGVYGDPFIARTTLAPTVGSWADVVDRFDVDTQRWLPPNGVVTFLDVNAAIGEFQQLGHAPVVWVDLVPQWPNYVVNFADVAAVLAGFQDTPYFDSVPGFASLADCPLGGPP